ncbi:MAG: hypothetical protein KAT68_05960 [Bacteroidales bacterium]|nr:hypothetical protein [Bacteroidales bacterium]
MIKFLQFVLIFILVYYLLKIIFKYLIKRFINRLNNTVNNQNNNYNNKTKKEGEISVDYIPDDDKNRKGENDFGEYIDFEDIKE